MAEKSKEKIKISDSISNVPEIKTASPGMKDINEHKTQAAVPVEEKKSRFQFWHKLNAKRDENSFNYKKLNLALLLIFPLFICTMAEITQAKSIGYYFGFWADHPRVMFFNILIAAVIFLFLLVIFSKGWLAVLTQSIIYMGLSTTELFKYNTNGNHLILSDMKLFRSVKSLTSFAYIKITFALILSYIIVIAFFAAVYYFNPKIKLKASKRVITGLACTVPFFAIVMLPGFYKPVYSIFGIDTTSASNDMLLKEKFNNNSFLAFLVQTATESFENRLTPPTDYDNSHIDKILDIDVDESGDFNGGVKPNVIFIMNESYADFRVFDKLNVNDSYYKQFDKACEEGHSGTIITPTYASWTVRAEFELMFGLPVKGINDPNMPQREFAEHDLPAMARYYNKWGYDTAYVHPFQGGFYSRNRIYEYLGFNKMIFHDDQDNVTDFNVDVDHYGTYVDDSTVFNQLLDLIKTSDKPMYIHTTTMQNHQPYNQGEDPDDEFGNYLQWIQHTNEGLEKFLDSLEKLDEPTLVFFVGDHFPSLRGETSVYNQLDLDGENCSDLYRQKYLLWSNYGADFSNVPTDEFSFFYMPYVVIDIIDAPHDAFIEKMMYYLKQIPVYSTSYDNSTPHDEDLDALTYDRIVGDAYSTSPLNS